MAFSADIESKTRFVPWFNMDEWNQVYKQIFSDDTASQVKGFERLLVWKARCPQGIPVGAQCTLDLIQICLKDREVWPQITSGVLPPYHEHGLENMYALAVVRFLNHLATLTQNKTQSLYSMAAKLHIPDWVVNIRHDTSHSNNVPSLSILREAAQFCLDWIHEHYWKHEAEATTNWIAGYESMDYNEVVHHLKEIVEMWQAVMLYSSAGFTTFAEIPDLELQKHLIDEKQKFGEKKMDTMMKKLKRQGHALAKKQMAEAQALIINQLKKCMKTSSRFGDTYEILVNVLLEGDGFLASPNFISVFDTSDDASRLTNDSLPLNFLTLWKAMLNFLLQSRVIPLLVEKLIHMSSSENESNHRRKMAALWVKELAQSLGKVKKTIELIQSWHGGKAARKVRMPDKLKLKLKQRKLKMKKTASFVHEEIIREVERKNPHLKKFISLSIHELPTRLTNLQFFRETILKPGPWTKIFLPSLMDLLDPPLPEDIQEKLTTLIHIYTQEFNSSNEESIHSEVHTLHNMGKYGVAQNGYAEEMDVVAGGSEMDSIFPTVKSHWIRAEDDEDWSKCPLGRLPLQDEGSSLQIVLPCDAIWQSREQTDDYTISEKNLPGFFHKQVNWDEVISKRQRKSKREYNEYRYPNIAEKAFAMISDED